MPVTLIQNEKGIHVLRPFREHGVLAAFSERSWEVRETSAGEQARKEFCEAQNIPYESVVTLDQVHGTNIVRLGPEYKGGPEDLPRRRIANTDAALTDVEGLPFAVHTADCAPLLILDVEKRAAGLAHVGWRGAIHGLAGKMVQAFRAQFLSRPADLLVAVGPMIRRCCYEVGSEFAEMFPGYVELSKGKRRCDLYRFIRDELVSTTGIPDSNILDCEICTCCEGSRFFSYRREKSDTGRICSVVMIQSR